MHKLYVTVYNETQAYGGPEEGGWYYMQSEPIDSLYTLCCGVTEEMNWEDYETGQSVHEVVVPSGHTDHAEDCPARGAAEKYHRKYVLGHKETYLQSFTHRLDGVSWLGQEDVPDEYVGEVATNGKYYVRIESDPPDASPQGRPHYE